MALLIALQLRMRGAPASVETIAPGQPDAEMVDGAYNGIIELDWALSGEYTDNLSTPTPQPAGTPSPEMGSMDIGFLLVQNGNQLTGYVDLDSTLIFTSEHTIQATPIGSTSGPDSPASAAVDLEVGPAVTGQYIDENIVLESERFAMVTGAGQSLQRQFRLIGVAVDGDIHRFSGDYRETIWGLGPEPLTLVGKFTLVQPVLPTHTPTAIATATPTGEPTGTMKVYLPVQIR
ncbi:MAG: hypothetical protein J5I90_02460 [Caldilineales bacterium]|nr:hypothetical protein [Caldilineales bacterium]